MQYFVELNQPATPKASSLNPPEFLRYKPYYLAVYLEACGMVTVEPFSSYPGFLPCDTSVMHPNDCGHLCYRHSICLDYRVDF